MATCVERPVWRRFFPRFTGGAGAYVRTGGHAAVVHGSERVDVLLPAKGGRITELGEWALLAIEQTRWHAVRFGAARGLLTARVALDFVEAVLDWCERDSA